MEHRSPKDSNAGGGNVDHCVCRRCEGRMIMMRYRIFDTGGGYRDYGKARFEGGMNGKEN